MSRYRPDPTFPTPALVRKARRPPQYPGHHPGATVLTRPKGAHHTYEHHDKAAVCAWRGTDVTDTRFDLDRSQVRGGIWLDGGSLNVGNAASLTEWLRHEIGTNALAGMFRRGDEIVFTPREGEEGYVQADSADDNNHDGPAQVRPVDASRLASRCQYTYRCCKRVKDKDDGTWKIVPAMFPIAAAKPPVDVPDMLPNLRVLRGVVHAPVLRPDGSLLEKPGYDKATGLLYLPDPSVNIPLVPENPTTEDVVKAVKLLDYMLAGFVFASESDKANFLGMLMTPILRSLLPPPYKLGCIGAPMPGSGKSLLAALLRIVHGGVFRSEIPTEEAELRKQVTTILDVTTGPVVQFDNVTGILRSSTLAGLLTTSTWDDRVLGSSRMIRAVNDRFWVITGNNVTLGGDLIRRALWTTIDPGVPDPHLRTGFAITDLEGWTRTHRGEVIHAILVIARSWVAAGSPMELDRSDSYAKWVGSIRGLLKHAGIPGVFDASDTARQKVGADDCDWEAFLAKVYELHGDQSWLVGELVGQVGANEGGFKPISSDLLPGDLADKFDRGHSITRSLGRWLANREGRYAGEYAVKCAADSATGKRWKVVRYVVPIAIAA